MHEFSEESADSLLTSPSKIQEDQWSIDNPQTAIPEPQAPEPDWGDSGQDDHDDCSLGWEEPQTCKSALQACGSPLVTITRHCFFGMAMNRDLKVCVSRGKTRRLRYGAARPIASSNWRRRAIETCTPPNRSKVYSSVSSSTSLARGVQAS